MSTARPQLFLASTSPARRALMEGLGIPYEAEAPHVDEEFPAGTPVHQAVALLARKKAQAVFQRHPEAWVLGADQLVCLGTTLLGKPQNRDAAREQLRMLLGKTHQIVTGVQLLGPGLERAEVEVAKITLFALTEDELERYLDLNEWEGCAGGYRVESRGQSLMSAIEGDRTNIQGLPMLSVVRMLRSAGFALF